MVTSRRAAFMYITSLVFLNIFRVGIPKRSLCLQRADMGHVMGPALRRTLQVCWSAVLSGRKHRVEPNRLSGSWLIRPRLWIGTGSTRQGRGRGGDGGTFPIVLGTFPTVSDTYPNVSCMYLECILIIQSVFHQDTSRYIRIHLFFKTTPRGLAAAVKHTTRARTLSGPPSTTRSRTSLALFCSVAVNEGEGFPAASRPTYMHALRSILP